MKSILGILFCVLAFQCPAQKALFKELRLKANPKFFNDSEATIIFPIVATGNPKIDKLINDQIENDLLQPEDENKSLKQVLSEHINEYGLTDVFYKVTFNRNNFLSFSVFTQGCGAYCSSTNTYFNFDLLTGKKVSIYEVILKSKIDSFRNVVQSEKINSINRYIMEEKDLVGKGIDSTEYDWITSEIDEHCINELSMEAFAISNNSLEIFDPCEFPHAIRSQEPLIELRYTLSSLKKILAPKFKKLLN